MADDAQKVAPPPVPVTTEGDPPSASDSQERRELDPELFRLSGVLNVNRDHQLVIDDRFIVLEELGRGGYGAVYKAFDETYGRYVAIKQLLPPKSHDGPAHAKREKEEVRELRLQKEMQIMANLNHPNIVHVHEYINHTDTPDGKYSYIVMELLQGQTLYDLTRELGCLPAKTAAEVALQLLNVIGFIHRSGYIHRDLKPENIYVLDNDSYGLHGTHIKLLDFGLAVFKEAEQRLTESGFIGGTVWYLSPEQCDGADADEQSDLFSVGVMLFELLTGDLPYYGATHNERLVAKLRHNYNNMHLLEDRKDLPDTLKEFVKRALSSSRAMRFDSAKEMHSALYEIEQTLVLAQPETDNIAAPGMQQEKGQQVVSVDAVSAPTPPTRTSRRNLWLMVVAVVVLLAGSTGVLISYAVQQGPEPATATGATPTGDNAEAEGEPKGTDETATVAKAPEKDEVDSPGPVDEATGGDEDPQEAAAKTEDDESPAEEVETPDESDKPTKPATGPKPTVKSSNTKATGSGKEAKDDKKKRPPRILSLPRLEMEKKKKRRRNR